MTARQAAPSRSRPAPSPASAAAAYAPARVRYGWAAALLLLALWGWRMPNHYSGEAPRYDSSLFLAVGHHWNAGRPLYRGAWDHKPPGIFFVNRLFAAAEPDLGVNAARTTEQLAAALLGLVACWALRRAGFSRGVALFAAGAFLWAQYRPEVIEGGNTTEEWGALPLWLGLGLCLSPARLRRPALYGLAAGAAFTTAALFKEPLALAALPWVVGAVWLAPRRRRTRPGRTAERARLPPPRRVLADADPLRARQLVLRQRHPYGPGTRTPLPRPVMARPPAILVGPPAIPALEPPLRRYTLFPGGGRGAGRRPPG